MKFTYQIKGMHCESCVDKVKAAFATANLANLTVTKVTLNPSQLEIETPTEPSLNLLNNVVAEAGKYHLHPLTEAKSPTVESLQINEEVADDSKNLTVYFPIFLITAYILLVAIINNVNLQGINWLGIMQQFMAGFFLIFSGFKLLDLKGFAEGYATYDLLAKRWFMYGYIYPFLELSLAVLYLTMWFPNFTLIATIIIMGFSSLGVITSLLKKQKFTCACLGTILKVPLSSITLIEDLTMVVLAAIGLII